MRPIDIIRYQNLRPTPWKNGGGLTREALRRPAAGEFRWRLSFAEIAASGPFSDFAGYHRIMTLLAGRGVRLRFDGAEPHVLRETGDRVEFSGSVRTECELIDGPCVDLNLMVSESLPRPMVRLLRAPAELDIHNLRLVVALDENVALRVPRLAPDAPFRLARWDTAVVAGDHGAAHIDAAPGSRPELAPRALVLELIGE